MIHLMEEFKVNKMLSAIALGAALIFSMPNCEATDVWVEHWNSNDVDIYVMDDTLISGSSQTGKYFDVYDIGVIRKKRFA